MTVGPWRPFSGAQSTDADPGREYDPNQYGGVPDVGTYNPISKTMEGDTLRYPQEHISMADLAPKNSDPFSFFSPLANAAKGVTDFGGSLLQGALKAPVLGGALEGLGTLGGLVTAPIGLAVSGQVPESIRNAPATTLGGGQAAPWDLPATARKYNNITSLAAGALGQVASDPTQPAPLRAIGLAGSLAGNVGPYAVPVPTGLSGLGALRAGLRAPVQAAEDVASADRFAPRAPVTDLGPRALEAPAPQLALAAENPRAIPMPAPRAAPITMDQLAPNVREFGNSIQRVPTNQEMAARDYAQTYPFAEEPAGTYPAEKPPITQKPYTPYTRPEPAPAPAGPLAARGVTDLAPIGREDLTLTGRGMAKAPEVPPLSLEDLKARIGAPPEGVPMNADELSRRIGATPPSEAAAARTFADTGPAQMRARDSFAAQVEARQAAVPGKIAESGMSGPLVGRAFGVGGSQLARAGRTGITAADLTASVERQAKIHTANESFIAAMKSGDVAAAERAVRDVHLLNGDLDHTSARAKAAGVPTLSGAEMRKWLKASGGENAPSTPTSSGSVPKGRGFLREEGGSATIGTALGRPTRGEPEGPRLVGTGGNARLPQAPLGSGWLRKGETVLGATKTLGTALSPAHFLLRHALPMVGSHPVAWAKGVPGMVRGVRMTPAEAEARIQYMEKNARAGGYDNLYVGRPHSGIVGGDESVPSAISSKLGPLATVINRSNQGFVMGLNEVRFNALKGAINTSRWLESKGLATKMTDTQKRNLAEAINHATGRGIDTKMSPQVQDALKAQRLNKPITMDELKAINNYQTKTGVMRALNVPMFSPQVASARVRLIADGVNGMQQLIREAPTGKVNPVALERARNAMGYIVGAGSLYLAMQALGGKTDTNPVSTDAGKVDIGTPGLPQGLAAFAAAETGVGANAYAGKNVTLDPSASESGLIRTAARLAVALYDTAKGEKNLQRMEGAKQETTPLDVLWGEAKNQLFSSPIAYPLLEWLQGYSVQPTDAITPLPIGAALRGAGIQPPSVGGKPPAAPKAPTPIRPAAPTRTTAPRVAPTPFRTPRP